ncbi:hypothetical protein GGR52DRAFT_415494 [Hypoxylon sp. FL1284]|nr:hypothetical protein GGR52DRAFT_415494 [Hypoxylon sp. FL1284]
MFYIRYFILFILVSFSNIPWPSFPRLFQGCPILFRQDLSCTRRRTNQTESTARVAAPQYPYKSPKEPRALGARPAVAEWERPSKPASNRQTKNRGRANRTMRYTYRRYPGRSKLFPVRSRVELTWVTSPRGKPLTSQYRKRETGLMESSWGVLSLLFFFFFPFLSFLSAGSV